MEKVYSVPEIIAMSLSLRPREAARCTNGDRISGCSTPVFTQVRLDDGNVRFLEKINGNYGAGYVRVSSRRQQQDGWSLEDQVNRIIQHFTEAGEAFRIFSDAGIPGSLPYHDSAGGDRLTQRLAEKRARRYEAAYIKIFRDNPRYARHRASMDAHLAETLTAIRSGSIRNSITLIDEDEESASDAGDTGKVPRRFGRPNTAPDYRPGLTTLVECLPNIHSLAVTDLSRISRSQILFADLVERLTHHHVRVVGLMEDLSWVGGSGDVGADIVAFVLSRLAEHRLGELVINILRGQVTKLEAGEPSGMLPSWLTRGADRKAELSDRTVTVRRIVDMALKGVPIVRIALTLAEELTPMFGHNGGGMPAGTNRVWHSDTILKILRNPALRGVQILFGIEWQVLPRVISDDEWNRIQERLDASSKAHPRRFNRYLASQLFRCSCGYKMTHRPIAGPTDHYACCAPPAMRKAHRTLKHVSLHQHDTERFLDELMRYDPAIVTGAWRDTMERSQIREDLERLEAQRQTLKARLPDELDRAHTEARAKARQLLPDEDDLADDDIVTAIARRLLAPTLRQQEELDQAIKERQRRLESILPSDEIAAIEARARAWDALSIDGKNALLLTLFKEWRVEGLPPHEAVVPVLNTLEETYLPPIYLQTEVRGRAFFRRFPSVGEWVASWGAAALTFPDTAA